jgi:hypothetical protein
MCCYRQRSLWQLQHPARVQKASLMLSVYKGNVHPVGLASVSRAQEVEHMTDKNAVAAEGRCTGNLFL